MTCIEFTKTWVKIMLLILLFLRAPLVQPEFKMILSPQQCIFEWERCIYQADYQYEQTIQYEQDSFANRCRDCLYAFGGQCISCTESFAVPGEIIGCLSGCLIWGLFCQDEQAAALEHYHARKMLALEHQSRDYDDCDIMYDFCLQQSGWPPGGGGGSCPSWDPDCTLPY